MKQHLNITNELIAKANSQFKDELWLDIFVAYLSDEHIRLIGCFDFCYGHEIEIDIFKPINAPKNIVGHIGTSPNEYDLFELIQNDNQLILKLNCDTDDFYSPEGKIEWKCESININLDQVYHYVPEQGLPEGARIDLGWCVGTLDS